MTYNLILHSSLIVCICAVEYYKLQAGTVARTVSRILLYTILVFNLFATYLATFLIYCSFEDINKLFFW